MDEPPSGESVGMIVFDFDGTLCDSANIKTTAFHDLYRDTHGDDFADAVLAYHLKHQGSPRADKIRYVEQAMLGNSGSDDEVAIVAERFSTLVEDAVVAAPLFVGVAELLEDMHERVVLTVASATPTDELRRIVARKSIGHYFRAVDGSPESKAEIIERQSTDFGVATRRTAMVGDQPSDAEAARATGSIGVIIAPEPQTWTHPHTVVEDFATAAEVLRSLTYS